MPLATVLNPEIAKSAGVAYIHYLSFMLCFAALVVERRLIRPDPDRRTATAMVITDIIYGIAALALLSQEFCGCCISVRAASSTRRILCSGGRWAFI